MLITSQHIWHAFISLVIWIAVMRYLIQLLYIYVDDSFFAWKKCEMLFYKCYRKFLPSNLTRPLQLWNFIGLPHDEKKQVFGDELPIIGFKVNPNLMRVCMSDKSKFQLIIAIWDFALHGMRWPLKDFQCIAGHLNWALNIYPYLQPGPYVLYAKTASKLFQKALLWVNWDVKRELPWVVDHLLCSDSIYFLQSISWSFDDLSPSVPQVYCNASPFALGIWYSSLCLG